MVTKNKIKKAIEDWDKEHISSLIEEDVETLSEHIYKELKNVKKIK
jgi:hypothetical protein